MVVVRGGAPMAACQFEGPPLPLSLNTCSLALLGCASFEFEFHGSMTGGSVFAHTGADTTYLFSGYGILVRNKISSNVFILAPKYAPFRYTSPPLELRRNKSKAVPLEGLHVDNKLCFMEEPVEIMDREVKRLKQSRIPIVKVRRNSRRDPEFT
ncbi:hypothetical protein Tco_0654173 [Tanacetum coccineum]|uniref:Reverse transcriptase domain-containing protein n=1 Tax=Tanacetum coccineum TaxID=301880 RepID=A0ABQ4X2G1_9ASTR